MKEIFNLNGSVVLITGAGGFLGREISRGLSAMGATVLLNGRNEASLQKLADEIRADGHEAFPFALDIQDDKATAEAVESISQRFQTLDVLVNNAYHGGAGTLKSSKKKDFLSAYDVSVASAASLIRLALPVLEEGARKRKGGASVVNVASMYGLVSPDLRVYSKPEVTNPPYYGAAKAALIQLTRYLACELAEMKIRVNAVAPGPFPSTQAQGRDPELIRSLEAKVPLGRIGSPEELVGPIAFLASDAASFVTGSCLTVDGGWTAW